MRPVVLTILDGWGYSKQKIGNAILSAQTPNIDFIAANYPSLLLQASGTAVGMVWGEAGNSEVGHLTIGAGRIVFQSLSRINKSIETGEFFNNETLLSAASHAQQNNSKFHIVGLLTSGSVHAYFNHILALLEFAAKNNLPQVKLHLFTDGKDSGLKEGVELLKKLQEYLPKYPNAQIATIIGRTFSLDRNDNWELTEKSYNLLTKGDGEKIQDPIARIDEYYGQDLHDSDIPAMIIDEQGTITDGDSVVFFNFREDSMRQITHAFTDDRIDSFNRTKVPNLFIAGMTQYFKDDNLHVVFATPDIRNGLAEVLSINQKKQLHIAETQKYAHATFFFNCLKEEAFPGETDVFIKSTKDPKNEPEMMATEITDRVISELQQDTNDFFIINYANADLIAHTGDLNNTIRGVETIDQNIARLKEAVFAKDGILIITADHGNAESLTYRSGDAEARHGLNPIPFYMVVKEYERSRSGEEIINPSTKVNGLLADIAPTILEIFGIPKPEEMTGESLFKLLQ